MSWGVNFPHEDGPIQFDNFKISAKLYALPSPINMATMIRQNTKLPPTARGSDTKPILITVSDTYLIPRSPGEWVWPKTLPILNVADLLTPPLILTCKYVNLKEPYNQDIKEQVTTKNFLKKKTDFKWNPQPQRHIVQKGDFQIQSPSCGANFLNNISITQVRVNEKKN